MIQLNELQKSLLALASRKTLIERALLAASRARQDQDALFSLTNYIQVLLSSFDEEWRVFEGLGGENESVRETARIASPATRRVRVWAGGIEVARNSLLAHARKKNADLLDVWSWMNSGKAPLRYAEVLVLGQCAALAVATAICRHQEQRDHAVSLLSKSIQPIREPTTGADSWNDFKAEVAAIRAEIVARDPSLEEKFNGETSRVSAGG